MESKDLFSKWLELYKERFDVCFPREMTTDSSEKTINEIDECLKRNQKAEIVYPEKYGAMEGLEV